MFAIQSYGDIMSTCAPMTRQFSQQLDCGCLKHPQSCKV